MDLVFEKYQGTGNDFILLDNRSGAWNNLAISVIQKLCDRRFGIGADGFIKINHSAEADFDVDYYNSDGSKSFCGNGARCAVAFAHTLGFENEKVSFSAIDGMHIAEKQGDLIFLKMKDVSACSLVDTDYFVHTGSPHHIHFVDDVSSFDIFSFGKKVRYSERYQKEGVNVNAVQELTNSAFAIRTYERGVEDETLSCGTGVTAAALALADKNAVLGDFEYQIQTQGGLLAVKFNRTEAGFTNIWLIGPAKQVFRGEMYV